MRSSAGRPDTGVRRSRTRSRKSGVETFFADAPALDAHVGKITGVICGVRIEEIEVPLMQTIRYMDKLVDELAKGRPMAKSLRG